MGIFGTIFCILTLLDNKITPRNKDVPKHKEYEDAIILKRNIHTKCILAKHNLENCEKDYALYSKIMSNMEKKALLDKIDKLRKEEKELRQMFCRCWLTINKYKYE